MGYDNRLDREPVSKAEIWGLKMLFVAAFAIVLGIAFF
jgi:hypothetical protein